MTTMFDDLVNDIAAAAGVAWTNYQRKAVMAAAVQKAPIRRCLYYKTGAGKTFTALGMMRSVGRVSCLVIAPPSTHPAWVAAGTQFGVEVETMSHAKFRMKDTRLSRQKAVIADEFHLFGGHSGAGWKKLDTLARHLDAPLVLASATPNYNDAERVYCIQHVLDPVSVKGGFLQFLYDNCYTEANSFSTTPDVIGFRAHASAADYLSSLPNVDYLPDDLVYKIVDVAVPAFTSRALDQYGLDVVKDRMIASQIEERHSRCFHTYVNPDGKIFAAIYELLIDLAGMATTPLLVFANHSTIATALAATLAQHGVKHDLVTGKTSAKYKEGAIRAFNDGRLDVLVGTASLATGTDGMDKVCDWLVILDDTDDDSLRRQLIGRIMPRGLSVDASKKNVYRMVPTP